MIVEDLIDCKGIADITKMSKTHIDRLLKQAKVESQRYKLYKQRLFYKIDDVEKALGIKLIEKTNVDKKMTDEISDILDGKK